MQNISRNICRILESLPIISTAVGATEIAYKLARKTNQQNPMRPGWLCDLKIHVASMSYASCVTTMVPFAGNLIRLATFAARKVRGLYVLDIFQAAKRDKDFTLLEEIFLRHPNYLPKFQHAGFQIGFSEVVSKINKDEVYQKLLDSEHPQHAFFLRCIMDGHLRVPPTIPETTQNLLKETLKKEFLKLPLEEEREIKKTITNLISLYKLFPEDLDLVFIVGTKLTVSLHDENAPSLSGTINSLSKREISALLQRMASKTAF